MTGVKFSHTFSMLSLRLLVVNCFALLLQCNASSFYDNPEQDPLPSGPGADDELHRKWDAEVGHHIRSAR